jgi:hypothetical protein
MESPTLIYPSSLLPYPYYISSLLPYPRRGGLHPRRGGLLPYPWHSYPKFIHRVSYPNLSIESPTLSILHMVPYPLEPMQIDTTCITTHLVCILLLIYISPTLSIGVYADSYYIYMYVYVLHIYVHIYIYTYMCLSIHVHVHTYMYIRTVWLCGWGGILYKHVYVYMSIHIHVRTHSMTL